MVYECLANEDIEETSSSSCKGGKEELTDLLSLLTIPLVTVVSPNLITRAPKTVRSGDKSSRKPIGTQY